MFEWVELITIFSTVSYVLYIKKLNNDLSEMFSFDAISFFFLQPPPYSMRQQLHVWSPSQPNTAMNI